MTLYTKISEAKMFVFYKHPHDILDKWSYIVSSHGKLWICIQKFLETLRFWPWTMHNIMDNPVYKHLNVIMFHHISLKIDYLMSIKMLKGILHTKFLHNSWGGTWTMLRKTSPKGKRLNLMTSIQPTPNYKYTYF